MKKTFFFLLLGILLYHESYAQTINDFNKETVRSAKLTYDEVLNPYVNLSLKNISSKVITTIEFTVYYSDPSNTYDIFRSYEERKILQISIRPNATGSLRFRISKPRDNYTKPSGYSITKVRYQDGTICQ